VSWLREFEDELTARHVRPPARERIVAELRDHIACEQGAPTRLGAPREIAGQYADELGAHEVRAGAMRTFGALACTAVALLASQLALTRIGGMGRYPGFDRGFSTALSLPAIFALLVGPQVALVAGTLAAWRALRRRRAAVLPREEVALVGRRARIGLAAGIATMAGQLLYVADFAAVLPVWWLALSGALAAGALAALALAWRGLARGSATVVAAGGEAGDLFDDIAALRRLRDHPLALWLSGALACGGAVTLLEWHAERSLAEGLERGAFEVVAMSIGFVVLGRAIGARR
jgi:uncharacterized membrane protein YidH (DUF202 family)